MAFLHAAAAVAEGAAVGETKDSSVSAALHDPLRRVCVLGGRPGLRRSLGSVYAGSVTRFLGGFRGVASRTVPALEWDAFSESGGMAVMRDGTALLVTDRTHSCLYVFEATTGKRLRTIGGRGTARLQFKTPWRVCITDDDFVFVADHGNSRIQVLTPQLGFHGFVGVGQLHTPIGVCANEHVIAVSESPNRISVFQRSDGAFVRRFGTGKLARPLGLCFIGGTGQIAVADHDAHCVAVFTLDGEFVRNVAHDKLVEPADVACSATGDLVVGAFGSKCVVFSASGEMLHEFGDFDFGRVAIHGSAVFALTVTERTVMFT
jgi:hypothetical protein